MCIVAPTSRFWGQGLWGSQAEGSMAAESPVERWVLIGGWSLGFAHLCFTYLPHSCESSSDFC